jgi:hypothetical protein
MRAPVSQFLTENKVGAWFARKPSTLFELQLAIEN